MIFRSPISIMTASCVSAIDGVGSTVKDLEVPKCENIIQYYSFILFIMDEYITNSQSDQL